MDQVSATTDRLLNLFFFFFSPFDRNDRRNVLSDIDSMLSDLNRELDQMLDYEASARP